ncbi:RNA polymerase sigma factor [Rhodoflexus caldus]|uniref:RNA polymerase sigma factor n=1 Tax=Rhodoflexus caldus TaxID=2891236 RepID=UPI00202A8ABA|nr:sigma-70 family RNA polymerase sigma factor [Rhodoflexus caldus]
MKILSLGNPFADEHALVRAIQRHDPKAEAYLYKKYKNKVVRYLMQKGTTEIQAEDLYQETMIVAMEKISDANFQLEAKMSTYLMGIATKKWYKLVRKENPTVPIVADGGNDEDGDAPTGILEKFLGAAENDSEWQEEQLQVLRLGLSKIGEQCRQLLDAWYERKWGTSDELAVQFGKSSGEALKKAVHKCREKLREIVIPAWNKKLQY